MENNNFLKVEQGSQGRRFYPFKVEQGSIKVEYIPSTFPNALKAFYMPIYSIFYMYIIKVDKVAIVMTENKDLGLFVGYI